MIIYLVYLIAGVPCSKKYAIFGYIDGRYNWNILILRNISLYIDLVHLLISLELYGHDPFIWKYF